MRFTQFGLPACALLLSVGALAQSTQPCTSVVPNLIYSGHGTLTDGNLLFRPEVINVDWVTIRDILTCNGVEITDRLIVQVIRVNKVTPYLKCTAFVNGPGAGINTRIGGSSACTPASFF